MGGIGNRRDGEGGLTWLVLGDRGFIGAEVRRAVEARGGRVIGASRSDEADLVCDLADRESIERAIAVARPDRIVNAAGPPSVAWSWQYPERCAELHAVAAIHLLESARRHVPEAHLTFLSSAEVYGSSDEDFDEEAPIRPLTPYGAAKAAMELFCEQHTRAHGSKIAVLRLFNQIGPGLAPGHAIADFVAAVARAEAAREPVARLVLGNPDAVRDYTDVRDCAAAITTVAEREVTGTFNLCSGRAVGMRDLIAALAEAASIPVEFEHDPSLARPADPARKVGHPDRLTAATGWTAKTPLSETLADMLTAARGRVGS